MRTNANKNREQAAYLVADDKLTDRQIAIQLNINVATLERWKLQADFQARVAQIVAEFRQKILTQGIADRVNRVRALNDRWERLQKVMDERALDPEMQGVPGGKTGTVVKRQKMIGSGKEAEVVEEFAVDTALMAELRNHEKQAAQELGQWTEKVAPTDPSGQNEYVGLSDIERAERVATLLDAARARRVGQASMETEA